MIEPTIKRGQTATVDNTVCYRSDCDRFIFHWQHGWLPVYLDSFEEEYVIINKYEFYLNQ